MACNECELSFMAYQAIIVSVKKSGTNALLYVENRGGNIVMIRRILLSYTTASGGGGTLYLRPPGESVSWAYPSAFLETETKALFYTLNASSARIVQAQAEYVEIDGRGRSCPANF